MYLSIEFLGHEDNSLVGKVHAWNYSTHGLFPGECGVVKGGAGEFYPPRHVQIKYIF